MTRWFSLLFAYLGSILCVFSAAGCDHLGPSQDGKGHPAPPA